MQAMSDTVRYAGSGVLSLVGINMNARQPEWIVFVKSWMNKPKEAGTPFSTSTYVAEKMVRPIQVGTADTPARNFLEIGPGTGVVTDLFVKKLGPNDKLHIVEIEEGFYNHIKEKYKDDPRVIVHLADISTWSVKEGEKDIEFDAIAAGVPLNGLPNVAVLKTVLLAYERLVKKGGEITVVEYVGTSSVSRLFKGEEFQKVFDLKCKFLEHHKSKEADIIWWNFPVPARVHTLAINNTYFRSE